MALEGVAGDLKVSQDQEQIRQVRRVRDLSKQESLESALARTWFSCSLGCWVWVARAQIQAEDARSPLRA